MADRTLDVFISYSHRDTAIKDSLRAHLAILERTRKIRIWDDGAIVAGDDWVRAIRQHLLEADLVLLLISADFINSDYCYLEEMCLAGERHARGEAVIVPVIVRDCSWQGLPVIEEHSIQVIPPGGRPVYDSTRDRIMDDLLKQVTEELRTLVDLRASRLGASTPRLAPVAAPSTQAAIPPLVADLCDRGPQDEVFADTLRASQAAQVARRPFLFVIFGGDEQRHLGLHDRLAEIRVARALKAGRARVDVEQVVLDNPQLAYVRDPQAAFMSELGNQLLDDRGATMDQLVQYVANHEPVLLLRSLFDESRDSAERVRLLVAAMLSFWNAWPDLSPDKALLHCICIRFDQKDEGGRTARAARRNLREFLAQLWQPEPGFKDAPRVAGAVLPELQSVHRADVLDWAGKREVRRFSDILPEDVAELYERFSADRPDRLIPMEPLHKAIYRLVVAKRV